MNLSSVKTNQRVIITSCRDKRLCDLGVIPGKTVLMIMPGNTCIIKVDNCILGIGKRYQTMIEVTSGENEVRDCAIKAWNSVVKG